MDAVGINLSHWEELASIHGKGNAMYDIEALAGGWDSRTAVEREAVASVLGDDLTGKRIMHLQSHIGFDAISMARLGADVTAVDFSPIALAKAQELAEKCDVSLNTVHSDATDLPGSLAGSFDLVYANIGAICWIEDLAVWMRAAVGALAPGGSLVLADLHPMCLMFDTIKPLKLGYPYAFDGPRVFEDHGSYADANAKVEQVKTVSFAHSLGEIHGTARAAGLAVDRFDEHLEIEFDCWGDGGLEREDDGMWRVRLQGYALPILFVLIARKPA